MIPFKPQAWDFYSTTKKLFKKNLNNFLFYHYCIIFANENNWAMIYLASFIIFFAIMGLVFYFRQRHSKMVLAKECAKEAEQFHKKLQELSSPSRFFTDEEAQNLKKEFAPLLKKVNKLYESTFISNDFLNKLGLRDFLDERALVNHKQYKNNQEYNLRYYKK